MANETKLANIINPEVLADMVSAELPNALQLSGLYKVDRTLTGRPGNTITIPVWDYIGAADDLAEGAEGTVTQMSATDQDFTVKKAVKNIVLTDEAVLSGYGDPMGEAARQLRMSIADKVDNDGIALLKSFTTNKVDWTENLTYNAVCAALDKFADEEQGGDKIILVGQEGIRNLRLDPRFSDAYTLADGNNSVVKTGVVGAIAGCKVKISNKLNGVGDGVAYVLKPQAVTAFIKRDVNLETERQILKKQTLISVDEHFVVAIEDKSKIVRINFDADYTPTPAPTNGGNT